MVLDVPDAGFELHTQRVLAFLQARLPFAIWMVTRAGGAARSTEISLEEALAAADTEMYEVNGPGYNPTRPCGVV